ncbi:hypothetical protein F0562_023130 [Nyssa sinensis]|uniref:Uncharacterized protein n=1 Tax=Nyssa sinensis TaxID=561372 RepID=A0A5J5BH73_9ASTE|nr:hypothetical protein F0562_023130 [Nyssa sinensis]
MENGDAWLAPDKLYHFLFCFFVSVTFSLIATRTPIPLSAVGASGSDQSLHLPPVPRKRPPMSLASSNQPVPPPKTPFLTCLVFSLIDRLDHDDSCNSALWIVEV